MSVNDSLENSSPARQQRAQRLTEIAQQRSAIHLAQDLRPSITHSTIDLESEGQKNVAFALSTLETALKKDPESCSTEILTQLSQFKTELLSELQQKLKTHQNSLTQILTNEDQTLQNLQNEESRLNPTPKPARTKKKKSQSPQPHPPNPSQKLKPKSPIKNHISAQEIDIYEKLPKNGNSLSFMTIFAFAENFL
jgi:hypothetical protein